MAQYKITNQPAPLDFECNSKPILRTVQNAKNLLMCRMGEVPYDRYRGFDQALLKLPIPELQEKLLPELDRVMLWEPDVEVVEASCHLDSNGETVITVTIEVTFEEGGA